jgi:pyruvate/2-oxoglutarate dehydrogenase complex dihydrolipoamide dehydrogenase (E3) component
MHMLWCCLQDILIGQAKFVDSHTVKYGLPGRVDVGGQVTAKDIIIATGSVPFVPPGELQMLSGSSWQVQGHPTTLP